MRGVGGGVSVEPIYVSVGVTIYRGTRRNVSRTANFRMDTVIQDGSTITRKPRDVVLVAVISRIKSFVKRATSSQRILLTSVGAYPRRNGGGRVNV